MEISATAKTIVGKIKTITNTINIGILNLFQNYVYQDNVFTTARYDFVKLMTLKRTLTEGVEAEEERIKLQTILRIIKNNVNTLKMFTR